jgi:hypothetical protein
VFETEPGDQPRTEIRLAAHRQRLVERLGARPEGSKYVRIYLGALHVLADGTNPDRHALAAHGLRELVATFFKDYGVPIRVPGDSMKQHVMIVEKVMHQVRKAAPSFPDNCEPHLIRSVVTEIDALLEWMAAHEPSSKERIRRAVIALDLRTDTSEDELERRVSALATIASRVTTMAHHGGAVDLDRFDELVDSFEALLLDVLSGPAQDLDELDALLRGDDA